MNPIHRGGTLFAVEMVRFSAFELVQFLAVDHNRYQIPRGRFCEWERRARRGTLAGPRDRRKARKPTETKACVKGTTSGGTGVRAQTLQFKKDAMEVALC